MSGIERGGEKRVPFDLGKAQEKAKEVRWRTGWG